MDDQDSGALSPWGQEEEQGPLENCTGVPWEVVTVDGRRIFMLSEEGPLPDGVKEGDEGVFVIRLVAATREHVEAARAAG